MARPSIMPATLAHVAHVCANLRPLDIAEVAAFHNLSPCAVPALILDDMRMQVAADPANPCALALVHNGRALCIFGVRPLPDNPDAWFIWMVGTPHLSRVHLLRHGKQAVEQFLQTRRTLVAFVWHQHTVSLRWLNRLGFIIISTHKQHGKTFVIMIKEKKQCVM